MRCCCGIVTGAFVSVVAGGGLCGLQNRQESRVAICGVGNNYGSWCAF